MQILTYFTHEIGWRCPFLNIDTFSWTEFPTRRREIWSEVSKICPDISNTFLAGAKVIPPEFTQMFPVNVSNFASNVTHTEKLQHALLQARQLYFCPRDVEATTSLQNCKKRDWSITWYQWSVQRVLFCALGLVGPYHLDRVKDTCEVGTSSQYLRLTFGLHLGPRMLHCSVASASALSLKF